MEIGYRILRREDIGLHPLPFAQISLFQTANWDIDGEQAVQEKIAIARSCKKSGIRTVLHPIDYFISHGDPDKSLDVIRRLSEISDLGVIIHDEGRPGEQRLSPEQEKIYKKNLGTIRSWCPVSIENAFNSKGSMRFWDQFVTPADNVFITIDIGHLESAGIDSDLFVRNLPEHLVRRVNFVHMHHSGEEHYGIKDHWPLVPGCREISALKTLLARKPDVRVILELDAQEPGMKESIELLNGLQ